MIADVSLAASGLSDPAAVVRRFNAAWAPGDLEAAMRLVGEHAVYNLYIAEDLLPTAGQTVGRAAIEAGLRKVREEFDYLLYRPLDLSVSGSEVRHQVEFMYRHRRSGELLSGRFRMVMCVEEGLIVRADEYHDRAKVEAFLRLFAT